MSATSNNRRGAEAQRKERQLTVTLPLQESTGFPLPYHELVAPTQASDAGDTARVGIACNFAAVYFWINGEMHILSMEKLVNALIPQLLPERFGITEAGRKMNDTARAESEVARG